MQNVTATCQGVYKVIKNWALGTLTFGCGKWSTTENQPLS